MTFEGQVCRVHIPLYSHVLSSHLSWECPEPLHEGGPGALLRGDTVPGPRVPLAACGGTWQAVPLPGLSGNPPGPLGREGAEQTDPYIICLPAHAHSWGGARTPESQRGWRVGPTPQVLRSRSGPRSGQRPGREAVLGHLASRELCLSKVWGSHTPQQDSDPRSIQRVWHPTRPLSLHTHPSARWLVLPGVPTWGKLRAGLWAGRKEGAHPVLQLLQRVPWEA